jgi:hypothetical protein
MRDVDLESALFPEEKAPGRKAVSWKLSFYACSAFFSWGLFFSEVPWYWRSFWGFSLSGAMDSVEKRRRLLSSG